ncbi:MAG: [acyl-carrier-protein] S-malonyltransferase [Rickettsiaceae bacterium]|nr:MAG: [acyl-carrier-protein] S-malonyltransferase [Rickettsiaceae bacterium]
MNRAFIFPGQGSQIIGMGKDFYDNFLVAKETFLAIDDVLKFKLSKIIFNGPDEDLTATINTQPALMAVSMAIINVLKSETGLLINNLCDITAGHSLGEYSALCAVGALTLEDTASLLQVRGRSMQEACHDNIGAMAACLGIDSNMLETIIDNNITSGVCQIANDNMMGQIVISGHQENIDQMIIILKESGFRAIKLKVSAPFHCQLMKSVEQEMMIALEQIEVNHLQIPIIPNITATKTTSVWEVKDNLIQQICGTVRWRETINHLLDLEVTQIVEIGSGKVLTNMLKKGNHTCTASSISNIEELKNFLNYF